MLGAGFSQALGAPLFNDLFQLGPSRHLAALYSAPGTNWEHYGRILDFVAALYHEHVADGREGRSEGRKYWNNPETFLECVELDEFRSTLMVEIEAFFKVPERSALVLSCDRYVDRTGGGAPKIRIDFLLSDLPYWARVLLAFECDSFLKQRAVSQEAEHWLPYLNWYSNLTSESDTVLTFNYDLVLEELEALGGARKFAFPISEAELKETGRVTVLKLHGSINWEHQVCKGGVPAKRCGLERRGEGESLERKYVGAGDHHVPRGLAHGQQLLMGVPGPGKKKTAEGFLKPLWEEAVKRLVDAEDVVFVGYRFPPTDTFALQRILGALQTRVDKRRALIALGPRRDDNFLRVANLLKFTNCDVSSASLFAQDMMLLFNGETPVWPPVTS